MGRKRLWPVSRRSRRLILILVALSSFILSPGVARAHAALVQSEPEPGAELSTTPGVVVLRFTEPLNVDLSRAEVIGPDGRRFVGEASADEKIRVVLSTNAPGVYTVAWTTVSTLDGHTLSGEFRFGVGVDPGSGAEGSTSTGPRGGDLLIAILRALEYVALLLALGMLLLGRLGRREPKLDWVRPRLRPVLFVALLSGFGVVFGEALAAAPGLSVGPLVSYVTTGLPGIARITRLVAEVAAVSASFLGRGRLRLTSVLAAIAALAAAGHAAAVRPEWLGIGVDAVHLIAAGVWAGGILGLATLRPPDGWRGAAGRDLLERFSPVGIPAFSITVAAGAVRGFQEVGHWGELVTTSYGFVLTVKVLLVLTMIPLSALAWRRVLGSPRLEAAVAVFVIGAAALLAAYPLPPGRVSEAEAARESARSASGLPEAGDLTLGGDAGQVLVGLTLRPGEPGPNEVLAYLLPLEGEEAAAGLRASLTVGGNTLIMQDCGATCRKATVDLAGGEQIEVRVEGAIGGTAAFQLPSLPAPDGSQLLLLMMQRMHELQTYRLSETLSSGLAVVRSTYAFQAPDRFESHVTQSSGDSRQVWIGGTRYLNRGDGRWEVEKGGPQAKVPFFIWDSFRPFLDARVLGSDVVSGVPTQIVAFFGDPGRTIPVWFRLWIDADGLVRRARMRAQGHFMEHRYYDFDAPFKIKPPIGPSSG